MTLGVLSTKFISTASADVTGVFTQDFRQVFTNARPVKATVKPSAKLMEHPLETGATITDHRVILPVEIELSLILKSNFYSNAYQEIKQLYDQATLLIVQTRGGVFNNQLIESLPFEENPETYDVLTVALKLKQVQFVTPQYGVVPRNKNQSSTVQRGGQQTKEVPEKGVLFNLYSKAFK